MASMDEMRAAYEEVARWGDFQQMGSRLPPAIRESTISSMSGRNPASACNMAALQKMGEVYPNATTPVVQVQADAHRRRCVRHRGQRRLRRRRAGAVRGRRGGACDGKVARMTEYFANPFEAPAWRASFVER